MPDYAKDVLVETDWVEEHLDDDSIRIVEVDENPQLYAEAHIWSLSSRLHYRLLRFGAISIAKRMRKA